MLGILFLDEEVLKDPHSIPVGKSYWLQKSRSGKGCSIKVIILNIVRGSELISSLKCPEFVFLND